MFPVIRQGDALYDTATGLLWAPPAFTLTAPASTSYGLDQNGRLTRVDFTDGMAWLVTDAGIAADNGDPRQRIDFQRDRSGRIVRILLPGDQSPVSRLPATEGPSPTITTVKAG